MSKCTYKKVRACCGRTFEYEKFIRLQPVERKFAIVRHKYGYWENRLCVCKKTLGWEHNPAPSQMDNQILKRKSREMEFVG